MGVPTLDLDFLDARGQIPQWGRVDYSSNILFNTMRC